ncbi:hypothetical protein BDP81DRAFT_432176 [Colletotrichum phormii]|uniref:Uncharacterized protein n=1 Tax=Colletotrichum phormii TaxID=359342 RepID=A0AAJ0EFA3_9PEZI|nr:uncharacterized protein BDP81DRAFT_432176 [Colletotrichum phormii]KAK1634886.1 hypothetical protein BDP81DRAFT_432176 [Colletotrichum phormii]
MFKITLLVLDLLLRRRGRPTTELALPETTLGYDVLPSGVLQTTSARARRMPNFLVELHLELPVLLRQGALWVPPPSSDRLAESGQCPTQVEKAPAEGPSVAVVIVGWLWAHG